MYVMNGLVVVANRLPVEVGADGQFTSSPGGLGVRVVIGDDARHAMGRMGRARARQRMPTFKHARPATPPDPAVGRRGRAILRGFANAVLWPLFHGRLRRVELNRAWWHSYRIVNRRFATAVCRIAPHRRDGVGPRLPPAARPGDDPRQASRPAHRPVPAHPVPERAAVLDAAVAHRRHRGDARCRCGRVPGARGRRQLRGCRRPPGRVTRAEAASCSTERTSWTSMHSRSPSISTIGRRSASRPSTMRHAAPQVELDVDIDLPRHRSARLHQGDLATAARRSASCSTKAGSMPRSARSCRWPCRAGPMSPAYEDERDEVETLIVAINTRHQRADGPAGRVHGHLARRGRGGRVGSAPPTPSSSPRSPMA